MDWTPAADAYLRRVRLVGALYCVVPVAIWFVALVALVPFRPVYLLRLVLSLLVGTPLAAWANQYATLLWLAKHRSQAGPATVTDGAIFGACVGLAVAFVPPLTSLIASHHLEEAKTAVIACWLTSMACGTVIGGALAGVGRRAIPRGDGA